MNRIKLRAHHSLCMRFYVGKGYSESFTNRADELVSMLAKEPNTEIELVSETDLLCESCPHNKDGRCESAEKTDRYDKKVLSLVRNEMTWKELCIETDKCAIPHLKEICGDCAWYYICGEKQINKG